MDPEKAIPLLRVADVARSARWYRDTLGFEIEAFPEQAPHVFAISGLAPPRSCSANHQLAGRRIGKIGKPGDLLAVAGMKA
jgi:catechol 2,3-dioxygenase-like lactoylglutathione lyase family enzyme